MKKVLEATKPDCEERYISLVIENDNVIETRVFPILDYYASDECEYINIFVTSIHTAKEELGDSYPFLVYFCNCDDNYVDCMNDSISNLFEGGANVYVTMTGAILLWGAHDLYSTVEMQHLNHHPELDSLFRIYEIVDIYQIDGVDRIVLRKLESGVEESFILDSRINLRSECSVELSFRRS